MTTQTLWIVPEASEPGDNGKDGDRAGRGPVRANALRIALLDNSKANVDHLLAIVAERLKGEFPEASILEYRKANAAIGAPEPLLDRVANEADWAITAMAD
jgi:hypothetical protein